MLAGPKFEKYHFCIKKRNHLISSTLIPHNFFSDPRPEKCSESFPHNPQFVRHVGFQWFLRERVLKNANYLETRFSEKDIKTFLVFGLRPTKMVLVESFAAGSLHVSLKNIIELRL